jgi:aryl-alcohol dehydrogenase-like predicted oxidoreductase
VEKRKLGRSNIEVSVVGVGCNNFGRRIHDVAMARAVVDRAIDLGITLFDTADVYGNGTSESFLGETIGKRRSQVVIATKFGWGSPSGASRRTIARTVEASLKRLRTDYIDLYQVHQLDLVTPMDEIVASMNELVDEGKVRYLGCSNFAAWEVADAHWTARSTGRRPFVTAQNEYSLYNRAAEEELVPACERFGLSLLPYFPLAYGLLTGKYRRGEAAPAGSRLGSDAQAHRLANADWDRIEALEAYAAQRGVDILAVALGGLAAQPAVGSVIAGATRPEQVVANVEAGLWEPTAEDLDVLHEVNRGRGPGMRHASYALR